MYMYIIGSQNKIELLVVVVVINSLKFLFIIVVKVSSMLLWKVILGVNGFQLKLCRCSFFFINKEVRLQLPI